MFYINIFATSLVQTCNTYSWGKHSTCFYFWTTYVLKQYTNTNNKQHNRASFREWQMSPGSYLYIFCIRFVLFMLLLKHALCCFILSFCSSNSVFMPNQLKCINSLFTRITADPFSIFMQVVSNTVTVVGELNEELSLLRDTLYWKNKIT